MVWFDLGYNPWMLAVSIPIAGILQVLLSSFAELLVVEPFASAVCWALGSVSDWRALVVWLPLFSIGSGSDTAFLKKYFAIGAVVGRC